PWRVLPPVCATRAREVRSWRGLVHGTRHGCACLFFRSHDLRIIPTFSDVFFQEFWLRNPCLSLTLLFAELVFQAITVWIPYTDAENRDRARACVRRVTPLRWSAAARRDVIEL